MGRPCNKGSKKGRLTLHKLRRNIPPYLIIGRIGPQSPSGPQLVMDTNVQARDLLGRIDLMMNKAIGGVVIDGGVQVSEPLDV